MIKSLYSLILTALLACFVFSAPAKAETTVLRNFTVIDGTGHPPVPHSALIMNDGRISWVGPAAQLEIPVGAKVIDLTGKYVIPGLIDDHVHLGITKNQVVNSDFETPAYDEEQLKIYAAYGVTSVGVYGTDKDFIFGMRAKQRAGRPTEARIFTAGQGIVYKGSYGGTPGVNVPVSTPQQAIAEVDEDAAKGADFIKLWMDDEHHLIPFRMPYSISKAVIDEAHKDGLKAVAHVYYLADAKELVRQGLNGFAHEIRDQPVDQELIDLMKGHGTWQSEATLNRELAYSEAILPFLMDPFFERGASPGTLDELRSPARLNSVVLEPATVAAIESESPLQVHVYKGIIFPDYDRVVRQALLNFGREASAGIPYGMGTDSGAPGRFPGFSAHVELFLMVRAGITPIQAIVAATSSNARWLGAKDIGTIAPGKWADLVVLDRDPLKDIRNTRTIDAVYVAGHSMPTIWQICRGRPISACTGGPLSGPPMPY